MLEESETMEAAEFSLYKRNMKKGPVFYARFRRPDGSWSSGKSTGKGTRAEAARWARRFIETGGAEEHTSSAPRFATWAEGFWDPAGRYARLRRAHGYSLGGTHLSQANAICRDYLLPRFAETPLDQISPEAVESYLLDLYEHGKRLEDGSRKRVSARTVNYVRQTLATMFSEAKRLRVVEENPVQATIRFKETHKERGILSLAELAKLFAPGALETVWGRDRKMCTFSFVAAGTGMRLSEIRALRPRNVHKGYIAVVEGWSDIDGAKAPKWNRMRETPLPAKVGMELRRWIGEAGVGADELIFAAEGYTDRPVSKNQPRAALLRALKRAGISEESLKKRNIVFHSLRHGLVTLARAKGIDSWQLRRAVGHSTERMLDMYADHGTQGEGFEELSKFQRALVADFAKGKRQ